MTPERIDLETLMAYADGVLPPDEAERVAALLATDAAVRAQLEQLRHGATVARQAFDTDLQAPVPAALRRAVEQAVARARDAHAAHAAHDAATTASAAETRRQPDARPAAAGLHVASSPGAQPTATPSEPSEMSDRMGNRMGDRTCSQRPDRRRHATRTPPTPRRAAAGSPRSGSTCSRASLSPPAWPRWRPACSATSSAPPRPTAARRRVAC
jgi:anti-sigma factor RsiW